MGRSVSVPADALACAYISLSEDDMYFFDDYAEDLRRYLCELMPSLIPVTGKWVGDEFLVLAENDLAVLGISSYDCVVALWIVPKEDYPQLAEHWISQIAHHIDAIADLEKLAVFSDGTTAYVYKEE